MNFDISHLLDQWDYQPGTASVRKFTGKDGVEKLQVRLDLGLLQMNCEGRPDGKRPLGHPSLYEYYQARLGKHKTANDGSEEGFLLKAEDCAKLQFEALQYYQRHNCLWQLEDYAGVARDTERNLLVCDFAAKHAESDELSWSLEQFKPQLLMMHTRARATASLKENNHETAVRQIDEGMARIREFYREHERLEPDQSVELNSLKAWLDEINSRRPLSKREKLERELSEAVTNEDYEKAAQMRDALRNLKPTE
ncbi:MAG TPA: UvrB/UvrC motif-containing protein [Verrucomicrobiae bacterium]|nr:UvrB/UvrC motif-containing protein [Verrucomicrobiae bacterium]